MKDRCWVQLVGLLIGFVCCVMFAGSLNYSASGQSSVTQRERKASKDYLPLSDNQKGEIRARAEAFYGTADLPNFTAKGTKAGHVGRGIIAFEAADQSELVLDVEPCKATTEHFVKPYRKSTLSKVITCKGKLLSYYEVEQQK